MRFITKLITLTAFTLVAGCYAFAASSGLTAKITALTGKVQTQSKGDENWRDAKIGDVVEEGTVISTGFNSNATLNIEGSVCTLQPLTRLSLEQLAKKDVSQDGTNKSVTKTSIYIDSGKATFKVNSTAKNLNDFKVHSPASTASVRGTEFTVYANGTIETSEGLVAASSGGTRASFNTPAKREQYFITPSVKVSVFTPTYNVGGTEGGMPVYKGEKIHLDPKTGTPKDPKVREREELTDLGSSTVALADVELEAGSATSPFTASPILAEEEITDSGATAGGGSSFEFEID